MTGIKLETVIAMIKQELVACESLQRNITKQFAALRNQEEAHAAASIRRAIARNNRMIRIHLERADALVKAGGVQDTGYRELTIESIRDSLDFLDYVRLLDECLEEEQ